MSFNSVIYELFEVWKKMVYITLGIASHRCLNIMSLSIVLLYVYSNCYSNILFPVRETTLSTLTQNNASGNSKTSVKLIICYLIIFFLTKALH